MAELQHLHSKSLVRITTPVPITTLKEPLSCSDALIECVFLHSSGVSVVLTALY